MENKRKFDYSVTISLERFRLTVFTKEYGTPYPAGHRLHGFGFIEDETGNCFWDNLEYFKNMDSIKKEAIKEELKSKGLPTKGVIKELRELMNKAVELGLIEKEGVKNA